MKHSIALLLVTSTVTLASRATATVKPSAGAAEVTRRVYISAIDSSGAPVTDLAAAVTGGIGLAASGNINPPRRFPSMFEPVHGSAPDIAGPGVADPVATVLSVALLLDHLGHGERADRVREAVTAELTARTPGAPLRTTEVGDRIAARVA